MSNVYVVGKRGSKAKADISNLTNVKIFKGQKDVDAIVNHGLPKQHLDLLLKKYPFLARAAIINKTIAGSKYNAVRRAEDNGVLIPNTKLSLAKSDIVDEWIEKRIHSSQGKGIIKATGTVQRDGKYYQKFIKDRKYELRVHAFSWIPKGEWTVQKRTGPEEQIAWNFHQGGHFKSIHNTTVSTFTNAINIAEKILKINNMSFGAVDLIVDKDLKIYFIEINSSPGFTNLSASTYIKAMNALVEKSKKELSLI